MKGWKALMIRLSLDRNWPRKEILNYIIQSKRSIQILEFSSSVHSDVYICSWIQIPWDLFSPLFDRFGTWEWLHWSIFPLGSPWHPLSHSRSFPLPAAPRPRASCWDRTLAVAKKKLWMIKLFLVIPFVTFLGWWVQVSENVTLGKGVWPPTIGEQKVTNWIIWLMFATKWELFVIDRAFKPIWQHLLREIGSCPRQRMGNKTTFETKPIYRNAHFYSIHVFDDFEDLGLAKNPSLWLPLAPTSEKKKHDRSFDCDVKPGCQATVKIHQNLHGRTFGPFCRPVGHGFFLGFGVISGFSSSTYLYPGFL